MTRLHVTRWRLVLLALVVLIGLVLLFAGEALGLARRPADDQVHRLDREVVDELRDRARTRAELARSHRNEEAVR